MEFHVIDLPKLPPKLKEDCTGLELWAKFINAERKEEFDMLAGKNPYIDSAYQQLQVISQDKQKRLGTTTRECLKQRKRAGKKANRKSPSALQKTCSWKVLT